MSLCVCKCLNITIDCEKVQESVDVGKLDLTSSEQRDIFFTEKLLSSNSAKVHVSQPALLGHRVVGRWTFYLCLACKQNTHGINRDQPHIVFICRYMQTTLERVNSLKRSSNFSPVFNMLVPEISNDMEMKENIDTNNVTIPPVQAAIGSLSKQLNQALQSQLEAVVETVRQFSDQKYAEYEAYRERAQREHKILASIISKARSDADDDVFKVDKNVDNEPPSPRQLRPRLASIKGKRNTQPLHKPARQLPPEEDSLEAEDIFELEDMESRNNMVSDLDDYDSDEGSNDEGIAVGRARYAAAPDIARSVPIGIAHMPGYRPHRDTDDEEGPQDIAASIKALARSAHGDVFELPRPRFSTQI